MMFLGALLDMSEHPLSSWLLACCKLLQAQETALFYVVVIVEHLFSAADFAWCRQESESLVALQESSDSKRTLHF